jgi:hypothetical protein
MWQVVRVTRCPTLTATARAAAVGAELWSPRLWERIGSTLRPRPAFCGYAYARGLATDAFAAFRWRWPQVRLQPLRGERAIVGPAEIEELRRLEARWHEAALRPPEPRRRLRGGTAVVITMGPLRGLTARVGFDAGQSVKIRLDAEAPGPVWVPHDCIQPLRAAAA